MLKHEKLKVEESSKLEEREGCPQDRHPAMLPTCRKEMAE